MRHNAPEVVVATLLSMVFWAALVVGVMISGRWSPAIQSFKERMVQQLNPSLVLAAVFVLASGIGGGGFLNPYAIAVFCQALIGLAIASSIEGFEPLPVSMAIGERKVALKAVVASLLTATLVVVPALLIGSVGLDIGRHVFGEADFTSQASNTLPPNKWLTFFLLLSGSGLAEETPFRLVCVSLLWKLTRRKDWAIFASALVFGAYHLTPLSGMYKVFWQFPVSQFTASALIGLVWGYLYTKRGFETVVLGHTLSNWLPMVLFMR